MFFAVLVAATETVDGPLTMDRLWATAGLPALHGVRLAYDHRSSGPFAMLAWGAAGAIGAVASVAGVLMLASAIGPWVRAQPWLPPVLVSLLVAVVLGVLLRRFLRESTTVGRAIALGEDLALLLIPFGIWVAMASWESLLISVGGAIALAGPVIAYWLQGERRRRGLVTD
jgi:hypothetical protein